MQNLSSNNSEPAPAKITRALETGIDHRPDWRDLQVQKHLKAIYQPDAEPLTRMEQILVEERDPFVRDLLLFRCGRPCSNQEGIEYAVTCSRDNPRTLAASRIKAMVIANCSSERIAHEFGSTQHKIEIFEKLFFDVRRYLPHRGWLAGVCDPVAKPDAVSAVESRWFSVAFRRGWPGVEEVVLGLPPKAGERNLQHAFSVLLGRVQDYCVGLEASGVAPSEKDIKAIVALGRIAARGLPYLWENPLEQEPATDSPAIWALKKLRPVDRDKARAFLTTLIDAAEKKALAQKSTGSKIDGPATNSSEPCS
jgi:hypothetical protein